MDSFHIPLVAAEKPIAFPKELRNTLKNEFGAMYLARLGVRSTKQNLKMVERNVPMAHCSIVGNWKSKEGREDTVCIVPNVRNRAVQLNDTRYIRSSYFLVYF